MSETHLYLELLISVLTVAVFIGWYIDCLVVLPAIHNVGVVINVIFI